MIHIPTGELFDKSNRLAELDVFDAYMFRVNEDWVTTPRFMEHNQLVYVAEGSLRLLVNKDWITLSAGQGYVVRRHATYASRGMEATDCRFYVVAYTSSIKRYELLYHRVLELARRSSYMEALLNDLIASDTNGRETEFLQDAGLAVILEKLLSVMQWEPQDRHIAEIVEYIAHHLNEPLTVEELGERFHYSGDYMGRLFRDRYGMRVKQYVNEQKIAYAKRLLSTSDMPIGSVGAAVGYPDELLFRKFFKYHANSTPNHYRKRYGEKP